MASGSGSLVVLLGVGLLLAGIAMDATGVATRYWAEAADGSDLNYGLFKVHVNGRTFDYDDWRDMKDSVHGARGLTIGGGVLAIIGLIISLEVLRNTCGGSLTSMKIPGAAGCISFLAGLSIAGGVVWWEVDIYNDNGWDLGYSFILCCCAAAACAVGGLLVLWGGKMERSMVV